MRILVVDSALARCTAAVVRDEAVLALRETQAARGQASVLPVLVDEVLLEAGLDATRLDMIAATVGPGSFTGVRAGLALAHGIGVGAGIPVIGVTVGEALAEALPKLGHRALWVAIGSRRGRVFLERRGERAGDRAGAIASFALDALPLPDPGVAVAVAGDAAIPVAAFLAARGRDVMLTDARLPAARHIALVAARRFAGGLPELPARPIYVDAPLATLPAGGLRPPPV
jgi:tRNA threonylcarbamoyl adenosine modification protein YeaZ